MACCRLSYNSKSQVLSAWQKIYYIFAQIWAASDLNQCLLWPSCTALLNISSFRFMLGETKTFPSPGGKSWEANGKVAVVVTKAPRATVKMEEKQIEQGLWSQNEESKMRGRRRWKGKKKRRGGVRKGKESGQRQMALGNGWCRRGGLRDKPSQQP